MTEEKKAVYQELNSLLERATILSNEIVDYAKAHALKSVLEQKANLKEPIYLKHPKSSV